MLAQSPHQFKITSARLLGSGGYAGLTKAPFNRQVVWEHHPPSLTSRGLQIYLPFRKTEDGDFQAAVTSKKSAVFCVILRKHLYGYIA